MVNVWNCYKTLAPEHIINFHSLFGSVVFAVTLYYSIGHYVKLCCNFTSFITTSLVFGAIAQNKGVMYKINVQSYKRTGNYNLAKTGVCWINSSIEVHTTE